MRKVRRRRRRRAHLRRRCRRRRRCHARRRRGCARRRRRCAHLRRRCRRRCDAPRRPRCARRRRRRARLRRACRRWTRGNAGGSTTTATVRCGDGAARRREGMLPLRCDDASRRATARATTPTARWCRRRRRCSAGRLPVAKTATGTRDDADGRATTLDAAVRRRGAWPATTNCARDDARRSRATPRRRGRRCATTRRAVPPRRRT